MLQATRDHLKYDANSESGLVARIDAALEEPAHVVPRCRRGRVEDQAGLEPRDDLAGRTNAEIATELFVSPRTVGAHVEHILAKLGASRRAEIATWVATVLQPVA